ncbi:hypothetical protein CR203_23945 [Salipaludibacillus neizhouensis]|uniref:Lipoprotein n=1 Tax=Salipaludibacillus neizhouensis TaxID=885475 RepID=A0A3A9JWN1_9BACI|nr:hypothetical protein [Salipaludibacillus neizhouensis]RKL64877.1 hypothetical protein CR203_23945 [Salipaludibacillus neizhouensis]
MKKTMSVIFLFTIMLLAACSGQEEGVLTRVDVQKVDKEGDYEEVVMITDNESIELLKKAFEDIKWSPYTVINMARKANVKATLFLEFDENMPERLYEYEIWFNESAGAGAGAAEIVSNNEKEGYGELDKENTNILRKNLLN